MNQQVLTMSVHLSECLVLIDSIYLPMYIHIISRNQCRFLSKRVLDGGDVGGAADEHVAVGRPPRGRGRGRQEEERRVLVQPRHVLRPAKGSRHVSITRF